MVSQHYKNWLSIEDERRCKSCEEMPGKIYEIDEIPEPEPPLHENCRCFIELMKAILAGEATEKGKTGADWWLMKFHHLPPYYITESEAKELGWRPKRGNLHSVAPEKMVTMGDYDNDDGHLPSAEGRKRTFQIAVRSILQMAIIAFLCPRRAFKRRYRSLNSGCCLDLMRAFAT